MIRTLSGIALPGGDALLIGEFEVVMQKEPVIAVVDDDASVCEGLLDLLNALGFVAETFPNADDFLRSDRRDDAACLISDAQMPGMAGLDLHDHLVARGLRIPTILITAFPKEVDRIRAQRAGVHCYLTKPFSEKDLIACIQSALHPGGALPAPA